MLDYQTLDNIADAFTPALLATCLLLIAQSLFQKNWKQAASQVSLLTYSIVLTYGLMLLDNLFGIWPSFDLDYSTHTAAALVLSVFLMLFLKSTQLLWLSAFMTYCALMYYQNYHTIGDILSTALVVMTLLTPITSKLSDSLTEE